MFVFHLALMSCSRYEDIKKFEVENIGNSNFSIHHSELYENEKLVIKLNDKITYTEEPKTINYKVWKFYNFPFRISKIEVKSWQNGKQILNRIIIDTTHKPKEIIISVPYPKGLMKFKFPPNWGYIPIEKSERQIRCEYYSPKDLQRKWY